MELAFTSGLFVALLGLLLGSSSLSEAQPTMLEAIAVAAVALVGSVVSNAYFYGKLTERVGSHGRRLSEVEAKVDDHETRISHLEGGKHKAHAN